jgi:hypothetical protein
MTWPDCCLPVLMQHGKAQYVKDLARDVARGHGIGDYEEQAVHGAPRRCLAFRRNIAPLAVRPSVAKVPTSGTAVGSNVRKWGFIRPEEMTLLAFEPSASMLRSTPPPALKSVSNTRTPTTGRPVQTPDRSAEKTDRLKSPYEGAVGLVRQDCPVDRVHDVKQPIGTDRECRWVDESTRLYRIKRQQRPRAGCRGHHVGIARVAHVQVAGRVEGHVSRLVQR